MAVSIGWQVRSSADLIAYTDLTSRVAGLDINQQLVQNAMASFTATVTLNNFDGALTPGGGGLYTSWDWFARDLIINAIPTDGTSSVSRVVYQGLITGFDLYDDGETSTVTLTVTDAWTVAGRTAQASVATFTSQSPITYLSNTATYGQFSAAFPKFGRPNAYIAFIDLGDQLDRQVQSTVVQTSLTFADLLNQIIGPSQNGYMWPGKMGAPIDTYIDGYWIGGGMTRDAVWRRGWTFDPPGILSGTDLPFIDLEQGWNIDETINTATFTSIDQPFGPLPLTATDTVAASKYGSRAVQFGQVASLAGQTLDLATELENRFATPTFAPKTIRTTASAIKAYCANAAYTAVADLLDIGLGFIDKATVVWKGAGLASNQTAECVILGKRIRATPSDTEIVLTLGKWTDFHSFILNTDKLDTDRLG